MNEKVFGQHNEEIAKIRQEISNVREKYSRNALEIVSDHNRENATRNDYKQRQISELLQNADDCFLNDGERNIHVKFLIRDGCFIALNDGRPFDSRGIALLMHADASSKYFNTIGCKGLGFRSVLNWSTDILICTQDFNVRFSESQAKELFKEYREKSDGPYSADLSRIQRTAILTSAEVDNDQETKAQ
ncbi:MAG: hypothetical protein J6O18_01180 [Bacilli bacterium]|nr:hypothetical protein [Bacilli bacterium]